MSSGGSSETGSRSLFSILLSGYLLTVFLAVPYYSWQYAKERGFMRWLILGEIEPIGKALVWPYYAFRKEKVDQGTVPSLSRNQVEEMTIRTFVNALNASQQALFILNKAPTDVPMEKVPDIGKAVNYRRQALSYADATDETTLDQLYPELGTHFKKEFQPAMHYFLTSFQNRSNEDLHKFKQLDDAWADWYMANQKGIEDAFNTPRR